MSRTGMSVLAWVMMIVILVAGGTALVLVLNAPEVIPDLVFVSVTPEPEPELPASGSEPVALEAREAEEDVVTTLYHLCEVVGEERQVGDVTCLCSSHRRNCLSALGELPGWLEDTFALLRKGTCEPCPREG